MRTKNTSTRRSDAFRLPGGEAAEFEGVLARLPEFDGRPIRVDFQPALSVYKGRLVRAGGRGVPVHAASDIRRRRILLEEALRGDAAELARVLSHELFHFVWARMSNAERRSWEAVLQGEVRCGARGELGWPSEEKKGRLRPGDAKERTRRWREYVCESFCDTAAWHFNGRPEGAGALKPRFRRRREAWFRNFARAGRRMPI